VLVSVARFGAGTPALALAKATTPPNQAFVCDQNLVELSQTFNRKFPHKLYLLQDFIVDTLPQLEVVRTPAGQLDEETKIRDTDDRPILRAAIMQEQDWEAAGIRRGQMTAD